MEKTKGMCDREVKNLQIKKGGKIVLFEDMMVIGLVVVALFLAGFGGFYLWKAHQYKQVFFPNTYINGIRASGKTVEEVKSLIDSGIEGYRLEIMGRDGESEILFGEAINIHSEFDGSLERILGSQKGYIWILYSFKESIYQIETMIGYDHDLLDAALEQVKMLDPEMSVEPVDACLSEYMDGIGFTIIPETDGTKVEPDIAKEGIVRALSVLKTKIFLEEMGAYIPATILSTDKQLNEQLENRNRYVKTTITYEFGDETKVLNGDTIHKWLEFDEGGMMTLNETEVGEYVTLLAETYNTVYQPKVLEASDGQTVTILGGSYGWKINQSAEAAAICEIIRSGESQVREPIYSQTAASRSAPDYGDTYVEINLSSQHLYYHKDGSLLIESDLVSGNTSRGFRTPAGVFSLMYKQRNATLKGEGYATPVSYWMPFNGGIGMHDASWRSSFGGTIYKTNGSHGCINLPASVAKTIYENISAGVPVLCYYGTGSSGSVQTVSAPAATAPVTEAPAKPAPAEVAETVREEMETQETVSEETESLETEPVETTPEQTEVKPEDTAEGEAEREYPDILLPDAETTANTTQSSESRAGKESQVVVFPLISSDGVPEAETETEP